MLLFEEYIFHQVLGVLHIMDKSFDKIKYIFLGITVGIFVGVVISAFRISVSFVYSYMLTVYEFLRTTSNPLWYVAWILVSLIAAIIVILLIQSEPDIQGSGIQDIEGHIQGLIKLDWFSVLWKKFIGGTLSLGSGMAIGREGPSIQIGSVVGLGVSRLFKTTRADENLMLSAGASAGLAAAFSTPVSGVLFIAEEIYHKFSENLFLITFTSAVTGNFIAYNVFGVEPIINLDILMPFPLEDYFYLVILGIVVAGVGAIYQKVLLAFPSWYRKLPIPSYLLPVISFLVVIPVGVLAPNLLGGGSDLIFELQTGHLSLGVLLGIFIIRFVFMHVSYGSGVPGGIFLPVLTLGALTGAIYATFISDYLSFESYLMINIIVYSMGALLTSVTNATLTSVMLMLELTGSVTQIMPLAIVCLSSFATTRLLSSKPIYAELLLKKVKLPYTALKGSISESELVVESNSKLDNMVVKELRMPAPSHITKIHRDHREFIPKANTILKANDLITFQSDTAIASNVIEYLGVLNGVEETPENKEKKDFTSEVIEAKKEEREQLENLDE